ncbi:RsmE family RNA methyltransferase [Thermodesulforhabdus norvegica]|uniref:Ribosomal RNA small subunit methyltransferase E n=1 Tax=Thermodesulforhabdus norvegica TaxID=39841 RepID=A0A1I4S5Z2_9BACT|nr:16S rRNA (uracil(1498)-N(3))-methyltransferase [Thermodesulforhabdus norvegica]SFM59917.1 16S rRNA (uracil1498-N3)-methyltransferase [Thermodesulforhabdus norvegica]
MTRCTFFCEKIDPGRRLIELSREVSHHVVRVHRRRSGDRIELIDGHGGRWVAEIVSISRSDGRVTVSLIEKIDAVNESLLNLVLLSALARPEKMDLLVRQTTELGVKALVFFPARMSIPMTTERATGKVKRWKKISREALCQCGRSVEPQILFVNSLAEAIGYAKEYLQKWERALKLVAFEKERNVSLKDLADEYEKVSEVCCCLGPEGGWGEDELCSLIDAGFLSIGLGPRILRYETAGVVLAGLCQYLWGDLGSKEGVGYEMSRL